MPHKLFHLGSSDGHGRHFNLEKTFEEFNRHFFAVQVEKAHIVSSTRSWWGPFGCYDPGPNQILLNRGLDHPGVAQCVVEYVLYHEMLHVKHPTRRSGCTLVSHSREFREEEMRFPEFERARRILDRLAC